MTAHGGVIPPTRHPLPACSRRGLRALPASIRATETNIYVDSTAEGMRQRVRRSASSRKRGLGPAIASGLDHPYVDICRLRRLRFPPPPSPALAVLAVARACRCLWNLRVPA